MMPPWCSTAPAFLLRPMFSLHRSKNVISPLLLLVLLISCLQLQHNVIRGQSHPSNLITSPASHDSLPAPALASAASASAPSAVSPEAAISYVFNSESALSSSSSEMHAPINLTDDSVVHDVVTNSPEEFTHTGEVSTVSPAAAAEVAANGDPVTLSPASETAAALPTTTAPVVHYFSDVELPCDEAEEHSSCPEHSHCVGSSCKCLDDYCFGNSTTTCLVTSNSEVVCLCEPGFSGDRCEHDGNTDADISPAASKSETSSCDSVHCLNGGICAVSSSTEGGPQQALCKCPEGFDGKLCENKLPVDHCSPNPCAHNGTCTNADSDPLYSCACLPPYTGTNCSLVKNPCEENPCQNGGTCLAANDMLTFKCSCQVGFEGDHCEKETDHCLGANCTNGEVCTNHRTGFTCACPLGYQGANCSERIDFCRNVSCEHGGSCQSGLTNYTCACAAGWKGPLCEADIDECQEEKAICNSGICVNQEGSFECYCRPGFTGIRCQQDIDECLSSPCKNNATCSNQIGTYKCNCPRGWTGKDCEARIDICKSNPCANGGTCKDLLGEFECECRVGWTGRQCETAVDWCKSNPCQNNANCRNVVANSTYECECLKGWSGLNCDTDINECAVGPCDNGGTCWDKVGEYFCSCMAGYTGTNCEVDIDECASSPCEQGGTCVDEVNTFKCVCPPGYRGAICDEFINHCLPLPHGPCHEQGTYECRPLVNNFTCLCHKGFEGRLCDVDIDECQSHPCLNGGKCFQKPHGNFYNNQSLHDSGNQYELDPESLGYYCSCQAGFEGTNCEVNKNDCTIHSCQNGGTCIDGINSYSCHCPQGFEGKMCQYQTDPCLRHLCRNGATCVKKSNETYQCDCKLGYVGEKCERRRNCYSPECNHEFGRCLSNKMCACLPSPSGFFNRAYCDPIWDCSADDLCLNGGLCKNTTSQGYYCECKDGFEGVICEKEKSPNIPLMLIVIIAVSLVALIAVAVSSMYVFRRVKRARATRGTYSPSTQEMYGNSAGEILKPPPEERLI